MRFNEHLKKKYLAEIEAWPLWQTIDKDVEIGSDCEGNVTESLCIGTVMVLFPSGKYYTFWTTNQTARDVIRDQAFREALEQVAERYGLHVEAGEACATDVMLTRICDFRGEFYYTFDGETFYFNGEPVGSAYDVNTRMDSEGYYPGVVEVNEWEDPVRWFPLNEALGPGSANISIQLTGLSNQAPFDAAAAYGWPNTIADYASTVITKIRGGDREGMIRDENGNVIGTFTVEGLA